MREEIKTQINNLHWDYEQEDLDWLQEKVSLYHLDQYIADVYPQPEENHVLFEYDFGVNNVSLDINLKEKIATLECWDAYTFMTNSIKIIALDEVGWSKIIFSLAYYKSRDELSGKNE